jgi:hypothetical protein
MFCHVLRDTVFRSFGFKKIVTESCLSHVILYNSLRSLTMSGVVLEQVNQVVDFIQVVDSGNSEFLGVSDSCAEEESSNSAEAIDSELH